MSILQGSVIKSMAGHDKDFYHLVVRVDGNYVFIADGKQRKLENPKRKNIKHIEKTCVAVELTEITNKKLRKLLSELNNSENK